MRSSERGSFSSVGESLGVVSLVLCVLFWVDGEPVDVATLRTFFDMRISIPNVVFVAIFAGLWCECFHTVDTLIYRCKRLIQKIALTICGCAVMAAVLAIYALLRPPGASPLRIVGGFFLVSGGCQCLRLLFRSKKASEFSGAFQNVIILGSGRRASMAWRELRLEHRTANLLGFVDDRSPDLMAPDLAKRYLCGTGDLATHLLRNPVHQMIVAAPLRSQYDMAQRAISIAESAGLAVLCLADSFTLLHGQPINERNSLFVELAARDEHHLLSERLKRTFDVVVAATALAALSTLFVAIAIAIKATSQGPVFFIQERFGYQRRRFQIWKFRSMVANAPELMKQLETQNEAGGPIFKIKKDPRITKIGGFLRSSSMDELPQLWNVLKGDMSLVGPRPMSVRDVCLFSDAVLMRRFSVKPGITGLWQVSGRSSLSFERWMDLDFHYIDKWSLGLDLKILARTVPAVLKRSGAA